MFFSFSQSSFNKVIESNDPNQGNLLLGDIGSAQPDKVVQSKCKAVVTVAKYSGIQYKPELGINHLVIEADDFPSFDLSPYFDKGADFVHENLSKTNVLVHCFAGVSRSTSIVIAYLMKYKDMNFDSAYDFVKEQRSCAWPNEGFRIQLKKYYQSLKKK